MKLDQSYQASNGFKEEQDLQIKSRNFKIHQKMEILSTKINNNLDVISLEISKDMENIYNVNLLFRISEHF